MSASAACTGGETGNAGGEIELLLRLSADDAARPSATYAAEDADAVALVIDGAAATVERLDLWLPAGTACASLGLDPGEAALAPRCLGEDAGKVRIDGPWTVDLISGVADAAAPDLSALEGVSFERASVKLHASNGNAPDDGPNLVAEGVVADARFLLAVSLTDHIDFEPDAPFALDAGDRLALLLDVRGWFAELPVAACVGAGDVPQDAAGTYLIADADGACMQARQRVRDAIRDSGRLVVVTE